MASWLVFGLLPTVVAAAAAGVWRLVLPRLRRAGWRFQWPVRRGHRAAVEAGQLVTQARALAGEGAWVDAADRYELASARYAAAGDARGAEVTRWEAARARRSAGRPDQHDRAAELLRDVLAARRARHDRPGEREALAVTAQAYLDAGRPAEAGA